MNNEMPSPVKLARLSCGMTTKEASRIIGFKCVKPYIDREKNPGRFTINEFFKLYDSMDPFARSLLLEMFESRKR